jgi:Zn-dependent peptidase ImmA (M78 family)
MITWSDANRRAAVLASELHADLDINLTEPVDVFRAIESIGVVLAFAPLGRVSGLYLPDEGRAVGILIHERHPRTRQRYTAGHELGHHAFHHETEIDGDLERALVHGRFEIWTDQEKEAEAFAAWFLMPRRLLRAGLAEMGLSAPRSPYDVYGLALWLGTSYVATVRQLVTTRLLEEAQGNIWAKIQPRTLKLAMAGEHAPESLRNDVHWLDSRRSLPVDAKPGDRLIITLDEIPSSGFSWRLWDVPKEVRLVGDSFADRWEPFVSENYDEAVDEYAGSSFPHSFILEIDKRARETTRALTLVRDQKWSPSATSDVLELQVSIHPALHGIQVPEREFVLTRSA